MQNHDKLFSKVELLVILLMSGLFIIVFNIDVFVRYLSGQNSVSYNYFNDNLQNYISTPINWLSDNLFTANITTFILWAIIGMICYSILYFFADVKSEVYETLEDDSKLIRPKYKRKSYYEKILLLSTAIFIASSALYVLMLVLTFNVFIPYMSANIVLALYDSNGFVGSLFFVFVAFTSIVIIPLSFISIHRVSNYLRVKNQ